MVQPSSATPADGISPFSPLRYPVFRGVWIASMASNFGGMIQSVGASWMMTEIADSAEMVALVQASVTLPIMLLALIAGASADNFDRRRIMIAGQVFMLIASVALAAATWAGMITPWLLLTFTFLIGCGAAFHGPAWQASVGEMVPRAQLAGAVTLNSMGFNIARSVGPAIGGAVVAAAGAAVAFAINAVSYVGLVIVLARWRPQRTPATLPRERLGMAMAAGVRYVALAPAIRVVLARSFLFGFGASAVTALMPLVARDLIAGGPRTYGLLLGAFGIGAVAGALVSARLRAVLTPEALVRTACLAFAAAAGLSGLSSSRLVTMALLLVAGGAWVLALSTFNATVQLNSPRWVLGRALSLYQMSAFGGMAAGAWLWGIVTEASGIPMAMAAAAGMLLLCTAIGLKFAMPEHPADDLAQARAWSPPDTALHIQPRSGPIVITIEFRIAPEDEHEFLSVMAERRRIRRRDGARRWTLLRDLAEPDLWIERFDVPNWIEYVRHNNRTTEGDLIVTGRARELHRGSEPPRVRRMIEREAAAPVDAEVRDLSEPLTDPRRFS